MRKGKRYREEQIIADSKEIDVGRIIASEKLCSWQPYKIGNLVGTDLLDV